MCVATVTTTKTRITYNNNKPQQQKQFRKLGNKINKNENNRSRASQRQGKQ